MERNHKAYIEWLKGRLAEPLPGIAGQEKMMARVKPMPEKIPTDARPSAVLCLLFPIVETLHLLLIRRVDDGKAHSGQIGFPGGKQDPWDADLKSTALREAQEEVGIMPANVDIIGSLTPLYIPVSNFQVYPFVGYSANKPEYNISKAEVAEVLETPIKHLLHPDHKTIVNVTSPVMPEIIRSVRAYKLPDSGIIWGATAMIISELETILEQYKR